MADPSLPPPSGVDRLSALPPELLHSIISYLFPTHFPDLVLHKPPPRPTAGHSHDLDYLAATSKPLRFAVNDWARSWLLQHTTITKFASRRPHPKPTRKRNGVVQLKPAHMLDIQRNYLRGRQSAGALLSWCEKHCAWCGKPSQRKGIFMNGFHCCVACDKAQWPNKTTKSSACEQFDLKPWQLTPQHYIHHLPTPMSMPTTLTLTSTKPPIRYGTYFSCNVATTMFLTADVRALATKIHGGDLEGHLAKRQKKRKDLRQKKLANRKARDENKAAKLVDEAREAQQRAGEAAQGRADAVSEAAAVVMEIEHNEEDGGFGGTILIDDD